MENDTRNVTAEKSEFILHCNGISEQLRWEQIAFIFVFLPPGCKDKHKLLVYVEDVIKQAQNNCSALQSGVLMDRTQQKDG